MSIKTKDPQELNDLELSLSFDKVHTCPACADIAIAWYDNPTLVVLPDFHNPRLCLGSTIIAELINDVDSCTQYQHDEYPEIVGMLSDDIRIKVENEIVRLDVIRVENGYMKISRRNKKLTTKILLDLVQSNIPKSEL